MQPSSDARACLRREDAIVVEEIDDDVCLYRGETNDVAVLNGTAGDIWTLMDGRTTVEQAAERLAQFYGLDRAAVLADVVRVVDDLSSRGFLVAG